MTPVDGVDARRERPHFAGGQAILRDVERDIDADAAPYPVRLHRLDALRPVHDAGEVEQLVRIVRDLEEPLIHLAPDDDVARALALAVHDLLVCEHRLAGGAPVHRRGRPVGQPLLVHPQEEPLIPCVVLRLARNHLAAPVVHRAHRLQLPAHALDVVHRPARRMDAAIDRRILRGQAERIESHRMQHVVAAHAHEASVRVGWRHRIPVPDVQIARGIRVHRQRVPPGTRIVVAHLVQRIVGPPPLPLGIDLAGVISQRRHPLTSRHRLLRIRLGWNPSLTDAERPRRYREGFRSLLP